MTNFTAYGFPATGASTRRTMPDYLVDIINVMNYGALGDGTGALLSSRYATLADAQAVYPGVLSLSDTIDWAAIMQALSWNSIFVEAAAHAYTPAVRYIALSWLADVVTAVTCAPHGLTTGDVVISNFSFSTGNAIYNGIFTVTVLDTVTFTYPLVGDPGLASADLGAVYAHITSATWASNVVTVNFGAPHRLITGLTCDTFGFSTGDGSRTITVTSPTQLTFPQTIASSGTVTLHPFAWVSPPAVLEVASWPGVPSWYPAGGTGLGYFLGEFFPTCYAGNYESRIASIVGTTLTFNNSFFLNEIQAGDSIRLYTSILGQIFFPPGIYDISQSLNLPTIGAIGVLSGSGESTIRGSFSDYLVSLNQKAAGGGPLTFDKLKFVNDDANGSCLRAVTNQGVVTACTFTSGATGLNMSSTDSRDSTSYGYLIIGNLFFASPGAADPVGIANSANNATVVGNYFQGLVNGCRVQEFFHCVEGNQFVDCDIGMNMGFAPEGLATFTTAHVFRGNAFINCGISINCANFGASRVEGTYIEGGADSTTGFYGPGLGGSQVRGMVITGSFSTTAIAPAITTYVPHGVQYRSVGVDNSGAGTDWTLPTTQCGADIVNCNTPSVVTYDGITGRNIVSGSYDSGTHVVTLTTNTSHHLDTNSQNVSLSGVKVGGSINNSYNGIYVPISRSGSTITYEVNFDPGGSVDANTGTAVGVSRGGSQGFLKTISWSTGTVSAETFEAHGIVDYGLVTVQAVVGGSYSNGFSGTFPARVSDATHFTYAVVSNPGTVDALSLMTSYPSFQNNPASFVATDPTNRGVTYDTSESTKANINDGQKFGGGSAAIGDLVEGGGSQHISVIWTRNGWIRRG